MISYRFLRARSWALATLLPLAVWSAWAAPQGQDRADSDPAALRIELDDLKRRYEQRLQALEQQPARKPGAASAVAAAGNSLNPGVSLILSGQYAHLSRDPADWRIAGFAAADEIGPGDRGLSLSESELNLSANIDPWFSGSLTLAIAADNTVELEEAYIQTTGLGQGWRVKAGRYFSGLGYLNEQHAHTWDFVDAPLAYQAFLGGQFAQDGLQAKWLLPTEQFVEIGVELGRGAEFPGAESRSRHAAGASAWYVHTGGDWGPSQSWRAGLSALWARADQRPADEIDSAGNAVTNSFTGRSRVTVADAVWKWAPNGNGTQTNLKLQGEYFHRHERGVLLYDVETAQLLDAYRSAQSGWYLQGVYQFMPRWRLGLRHEQLDPGVQDYASNAAVLSASSLRPSKTSAMLDWSLSEFSRLRLQVARERVALGAAGQQVFLQYQMSLGAHRAHSY